LKTEETFVTSRPRVWIACVLSLCCPGLGHLYVGKLLQGLVLFLASVVIVPVAALIAGLVSSTAALVGLVVAYLGLLGVWLYAVLDACRLASRSGEFERRDFQRPLVYAMFVAAGVISPMLSTVYVRQNLLEAFYLPSESMAPTLVRGDHILANKARWRVENIDRSDIVVFRPPDHRYQRHVKRVIGLPGDRVIILGNAISVNGQLIPEKPADRGPELGTSRGERPTGKGQFPAQAEADLREQTVAPGMCFVLGDNLANSHDSREYGQVPLGDIIGVAEYVYLPGDSWSRFGTLR
jgi:signal peptidase I